MAQQTPVSPAVLDAAVKSELAEVYDRYTHWAISHNDDDYKEWDIVMNKFVDELFKSCSDHAQSKGINIDWLKAHLGVK